MTDAVIASKPANALIPDATPTRYADLPVAVTLATYRMRFGGLWVGGRVTLTTSALVFAANRLNREVQSGTLDLRIPLADISDVAVRWGFVTKIIVVTVPGGAAKFRCFGAQRFAEQIDRARAIAA
jgi:hypothetical protein